MSYLNTVQEVRLAALSSNPNGRFIHGRKIDTSQSFEGAYPLIVLYPFSIDDPQPDANGLIDSSTLLIGFYQQDSPSTNPDEREEIIGQMDALCNLFLSKLKINKMVSVRSVRREPIYQYHQNTVSGMAVQFTLQTPSECIDP